MQKCIGKPRLAESINYFIIEYSEFCLVANLSLSLGDTCFFLLKWCFFSFSSHRGWKYALERKAQPVGKISLLPVEPSGRKLQGRMRMKLELQKLAAFACIYYRDTRPVFASIEKAQSFDTAALNLQMQAFRNRVWHVDWQCYFSDHFLFLCGHPPLPYFYW